MEVLTKLHEAGTIDDEVFETLSSEFNTMNSKITDARDESKKRRLKNNELRDDLDALKDSIAKAPAGKGADDSTAEQIKALTDKIGLIEGERDAEKAKGLKLTTDNALERELGKYELIDREIVGNFIRSSIVYDEDGQMRFNDNGIHVALDEGVKSFLESRPHLMKPVGNGGGSGTGGATSGNTSRGSMGGTRQERQAAIAAKYKL